jgi:hypothetical protein
LYSLVHNSHPANINGEPFAEIAKSIKKTFGKAPIFAKDFLTLQVNQHLKHAYQHNQYLYSYQHLSLTFVFIPTSITDICIQIDRSSVSTRVIQTGHADGMERTPTTTDRPRTYGDEEL